MLLNFDPSQEVHEFLKYTHIKRLLLPFLLSLSLNVRKIITIFIYYTKSLLLLGILLPYTVSNVINSLL